MTVTLLTSQSTPTAADADALVIGVFQGTDGPVPALDVDDIDLMAALTALGAAGKPEEITKIPTAGRLTAPLVVTVGLGAAPGTGQDQAERLAYLGRLQRAAGAVARDLTSGRTRRIALALPAGERTRPRRSRSARCWAATRSVSTAPPAPLPATSS